MKVAITGSNGFIGSALQNACIQQGIQAVGLCRNPKLVGDVLFDLNTPKTFEYIPRDLNAIIHTAYTTRNKDLKSAYKANIDGSLALFNFCHKANIPIMFLSSCSAHENARSFYGRSKYQLENQVAPNDTIIRPGFVIGDGGIYKRLENSLKALKFAPLFWGGQQPLQIIHLDDLINGILICLRKNYTGTYTLVYPAPYPMQAFYTQIFLKLKLPPRFIRLPGDLTLVALKIAELLKIPLPLSSENLLGLKYLKVFESDCMRLGIEPKAFV